MPKLTERFDTTTLRLMLLSGMPIKTSDGIEVVPLTMGEIIDCGYDMFDLCTRGLSMTIDDFINEEKDYEKREILKSKYNDLKTFDFYAKIKGEQYSSILIKGLSIILNTKDIVLLGDEIVIGGIEAGAFVENEEGEVKIDQAKYSSVKKDLKIVDRNNFDEIMEISSYMYYINKVKNEDDSSATDMAKRLMEKMDKYKKKVSQSKKKDEDGGITFYSIVSAVTTNSNSINKMNFVDYNVYQIYDEFERLNAKSKYEIDVKAVMAGAKDTELSHWASDSSQQGGNK